MHPGLDHDLGTGFRFRRDTVELLRTSKIRHEFFLLENCISLLEPDVAIIPISEIAVNEIGHPQKRWNFAHQSCFVLFTAFLVRL